MNNLKEYLLGFDARRMYLRPNEKWSEKRTKEYLINRNVKRVLSTDDAVWPSLFEQRITQQILDMVPEERKEMFPTLNFNQTGPFAPEWIGRNAPFWENLDDLLQHVTLSNPSEEIWIVAGTIFVNDETKATLRPDWPPYLDITKPGERDPSWPILGYDVSDEFHLSGLSNCGYKDSDFAQYPREYWIKNINEDHLFTGFDSAFEFVKFSNERIPEHAPFFVYGLYRLEILGAERSASRDRRETYARFRG